MDIYWLTTLIQAIVRGIECFKYMSDLIDFVCLYANLCVGCHEPWSSTKVLDSLLLDAMNNVYILGDDYISAFSPNCLLEIH